MTKNNLVTKTYFKTTLDKAFKDQDKKWDEKLDKKLAKNTKNIYSAFADFMQTSIIPILDKMDRKLDTLINISDNHERSLQRHDDKLINHDSRIGNLEKITAP